MSRARVAFAAASVGIITTVVVVALAVGPSDVSVWLFVPALAGVALAVASAAADPKDLMSALLFSLAPVVSLVAEGSPTWLMAPLAALLLVAAELHALSWESERPVRDPRVRSRRLGQIGQLAALGLAASWVVGAAAQASWLGGTVAVLVAAAALAGVGFVVFSRVYGQG